MRRLTTATLSFLAVFCLMLSANAQYNANWGEPYARHEFKLSGPGYLDVRTSDGDIIVEGSKTDEASVELYVRQENRFRRAGDVDISDYIVTIEQAGNSILAQVKPRRKVRVSFGFRDKTPDFYFKIRVPENMSGKIRSSDGNVHLSGIEGDLTVSTSDGDIDVKSTAGDLKLASSDGNMSVSGQTGYLKAKTSDGDIRMNTVLGNVIVSSSDGSISLREVAGSVKASTSDGDIDVEVVEADDFIELKSSDGNISAILPGNQGMSVNARGERVSSIDASDFRGELKKSSYIGELNGGGIPVTIRTGDGTVRIVARK